MELPILVSFLCVVTVSGVVRGVEVPTRSDTALVEARYDRYYDIFRYWWPWFSDLATVVAIKLKIWVILVAMLVFGDGYYWSKWTGSSIFEKSQWAQTPPGASWGRRRRRSTPSSPNSSDDLAEVIFDTLDIEDDECRKRIVCELYVEGKRVPTIWKALSAPGYEVFGAYRPLESVARSSDCRKLHRCRLVERNSLKSVLSDSFDSDWRWPR
ncbi:uncharacterized protein LOC131294671 [Anopheles ziemanni]|uniref:uncharacterized protein LOC131265264 n=1 Tax=Anopheles coustani TaxID=139045 RepID=UPI002659B381|nr:uncharacterized protein LOC131265264 [Anopheles coustani]XP_058178698.1 uncharacterized protein LOC131294671 [Anopheles ziemanni]